MVGQKASWLKPDSSVGFTLVGPEIPLERLLNELYAVYCRTTNPIKDQIVDKVNDLLKQDLYKSRDIFGVLSNCFCDNPRPDNLGHSLSKLWDMCEQLSGNSSDEIEVLHNIVFREETRDNRYKLGQFITEYPWTLKIAELVVEEFDKRKDFTLYEPCVGTGAITCEVITLLFRKYGKQKAEKIIKNQLIVADIDPKMRAFAHVVLWNHTEKLFGQGIDVDIRSSDLTTDNFDLSKMIVFGNYPFNAGNDYNYLAKILRKQLDCGLSHMVLMGSTTTFDPNKIQSRRILGDDFYNWIEEKYRTDDFQKVAVQISVIVLDKTRKAKSTTEKFNSEKFTTLEEFNVKMTKLKPIIPLKLLDGTSIENSTYSIQNSYVYFTQTQLRDNKFIRKIPKPGAPHNSREFEIYNKWCLHYPKRTYLSPKIYEGPQLIVGNIISPSYRCRLRYFTNVANVGDVHLISITGNINNLATLALILQSKYFQSVLYMHFAKLYKTEYRIDINKLKTLPIPKETEENKHQFDRLRKIGQTLIIENKEDEKLRKEADEIIEQLYNSTD